ncbi:kinesin-domain-containing protein [Tothia fuscella]|uniref:Kinesin-domain-containing protein n=1 Tax=Tothia fuscella TaxID=1048955 RepID=A0A9P4NDZ1_9PEZI|nr:kinesin-domain-containing protein [Tothia fuscella]
MSVRVVARIRPLLKNEIDKDVIVTAASNNESTKGSQIVRIPNPKNDAELYSFQFNSVYEQETTQQELFDNEVSPTVKHLFNGLDVTLFAYGVTGTGKTHTMRGGKTLADRGVIPRLLSAIYRRCRKVEKDSQGDSKVEVAMSYYEIYNDRVYDLFEAPEKRTAAGLPIRDNGGKTVVVGLTERPCMTLKEFEQLYDQANVNRSTSATKLNAHSSRSHAILCVKITQISEEHTLVSTASAIDLAGSEDNRRTDNNKERLVESSSINKSLFVLAQCVEAISKKQARIPYRESKMTRILSLGQNDGITVMILNLAPVKSYHLDTLSSLNFANRTKKIEVNEVENEPIFRGPKTTSSLTGPTLNRQPLRALTSTANIQLPEQDRKTKPVKSFSVYSDKSRPSMRPAAPHTSISRPTTQKRSLDGSFPSSTRSIKQARPNVGLSKAEIEAMIDQRVTEKIAEKALNQTTVPAPALSGDVQRRLDALEQRVSEKEDSEGLQFLLMAKQHHARGEDSSALRMYQLARPFFPKNEKLARKIIALQEQIQRKRGEDLTYGSNTHVETNYSTVTQKKVIKNYESHDDDYAGNFGPEPEADDSFIFKPKRKNAPKMKVAIFRDEPPTTSSSSTENPPSPRTQNLLRIINTRDVMQIRALKGVGAKKAEAIVSSLCEMDDLDEGALVTDLETLGCLRGVGSKTVENMRIGLGVSV